MLRYSRRRPVRGIYKSAQGNALGKKFQSSFKPCKGGTGSARAGTTGMARWNIDFALAGLGADSNAATQGIALG